MQLQRLSCTVMFHVRWVFANLQQSVSDMTIANVSPDKLHCQECWKEINLRQHPYVLKEQMMIKVCVITDSLRGTNHMTLHFILFLD